MSKNSMYYPKKRYLFSLSLLFSMLISQKASFLMVMRCEFF